VELEKDELIMWKRGANLKRGYLKIPGTLFITNRKLIFKPLLANKMLKIKFADIKEIKIIGNVFKKMKIATNEREYIFLTKNIKEVVHLVKSFL